jgi:hypothetical protein
MTIRKIGLTIICIIPRRSTRVRTPSYGFTLVVKGNTTPTSSSSVLEVVGFLKVATVVFIGQSVATSKHEPSNKEERWEYQELVPLNYMKGQKR